MSRRKQEIAGVRISDEEYSRLENKFEVLKNEFIACKRKLDSKCEALLILSRELDQCRSERDQFKLMAEQLRERHQSMKKQLSGQLCEPVAHLGSKQYTEKQSQNLMKVLVEVKDQNKSLHFELEDTKQKLQDAQGDIKLLREQIARQRVGTTDEGMNTRHFPAHEREELVQKLESSRDQYLQLERDLQTVLDEKEELVTERDVFKTKYERLNQELNYILKGDENRVVDIDALVMENKYLQDRLKQMEAEKSMAMAAVSKYKSILEKKKNKSCMKLGQTRGGGMVISQKQVQEVLTSKAAIVPTPQAMSDLQALAGALLDTVNDKNLALSHQRKTNKILGSRVAELEKKIKTLEVAGLWNVSGHCPVHLEKLIQECNDMKTLIPQRVSLHSESDQHSEEDKDSELESVTPLDSCATTPDTSPTHQAKVPDHLQMGDLDLLPTKEVTCKPACTEIINDNSRVVDDRNPILLNNFDSVDVLPKEFDSSQTMTYPMEQEKNINSIEENRPEKDLSSVTSQNDVEETISNSYESEKTPNECPSNELNYLNSNELENAKGCETLLSDNDQESVNENSPIHVYNEDKLEDLQDNEENANDESVGKELDLDTAEIQVNEIDYNAGGDANILNRTKRAIFTDKLVLNGGTDGENIDSEADDDDDDNDDVEASEKIGLLVESMAQKMCNISRKDVQHKSSTTSDGEEDADRDDSSSKLLGDTEDKDESSQSSHTKVDEPHNVEC